MMARRVRCRAGSWLGQCSSRCDRVWGPWRRVDPHIRSCLCWRCARIGRWPWGWWLVRRCSAGCWTTPQVPFADSGDRRRVGW